eukprot:symbB.v1.2.022348.t1/scaffold1977.1/size96879/3
MSHDKGSQRTRLLTVAAPPSHDLHDSSQAGTCTQWKTKISRRNLSRKVQNWIDDTCTVGCVPICWRNTPLRI